MKVAHNLSVDTSTNGGAAGFGKSMVALILYRHWIRAS
jgi:hypothetical protein